MPEWKVYRPSLISLQHLKWVISVSNLPLHLSLTSERMSCTRNRMFPITQWGESHAAALAHMFASSCKALPSRNRFLAQFWTPIDVLPGNNGPKSVLIPKVVSIGSFKINFAFLHSVWVMLGDKACSQRWEKTERGCCCQNRPFGLPQVFQQHRENGANSLCGSVGRTVSFVTLHLPSQEGLYVCLCVCVHTKPHVGHAESLFHRTGRICGTLHAMILRIPGLQSLPCVTWVPDSRGHAISRHSPLMTCRCFINYYQERWLRLPSISVCQLRCWWELNGWLVLHNKLDLGSVPSQTEGLSVWG